MHDHDPQCCTIMPDGTCCPNPSSFWVGHDGVDNYTYCCTDHLSETRRQFAPDGHAISLKLLSWSFLRH